MDGYKRGIFEDATIAVASAVVVFIFIGFIPTVSLTSKVHDEMNLTLRIAGYTDIETNVPLLSLRPSRARSAKVTVGECTFGVKFLDDENEHFRLTVDQTRPTIYLDDMPAIELLTTVKLPTQVKQHCFSSAS